MKHYIFTLLILTSCSCSKDEPEKPNTPPQAFEVTAKAEGTTVTLNWTNAIDAEGDAVTYAVVYKDTLAKSLTAKTFTIKDLPYETEIVGTVVATDTRGGKIESGFKVKTEAEPWDDRYVRIPDAEFEKYLIAEGIDDILDGKVLKEDVLVVKKILIEINGLKSLKGLEEFKNLEVLWIGFAEMEDLDLRGLDRLLHFQVHNSGKLKKINFTQNPLLKSITIDLHPATMYSSLIEELDMSGNPLLESFTYTGKSLSKLNLSNNRELKSLYLGGTNILSLDLSKNRDLEAVTLYDNKIKELNLCQNEKIRYLSCGYENLGVIYIPKSITPGESWRKSSTTVYKVCD